MGRVEAAMAGLYFGMAAVFTGAFHGPIPQVVTYPVAAVVLVAHTWVYYRRRFDGGDDRGG